MPSRPAITRGMKKTLPQNQLPFSSLNFRATPRWVALALLAGASVFLAATGCRETTRPDHLSQGAPAAAFDGNYPLLSVNGKPVPCVISHEGRDVTVESGAMTAHPDGTCRSESVFYLIPAKKVHRVVEADFTQNGPEIKMRWHGAGITTGAVAGNTFTMNNEGMIFVYQK